MTWADSRFLRRARWPRRAEPKAFDDFRQALDRFVLPGFIPPAPILTWNSPVLALGSCFAEEIQKALEACGVPSIYAQLGEEINSPLANWHLFDYAVKGSPYRCAEHETTWPRENLGQLRQAVQSAEAIILTLGVAFCAFRDGNLTISIQPTELQDSTWRLTTVDENATYIENIIWAAREVNPNVPVILTVSPIPLKNSFLHDSPVVADCLSKSTLRLAADIVFSKNLGNVFYWPSFEAIRWVSGHHGRVFGLNGLDQRHIGPEYIRAIIETFIDHYLVKKPPSGA